MDQVQQLEREAIIENRFPDFRVGDTVRVYVKVIEGNKERIQPFQGICIAKKKGGAREFFRVRKISGGIGVERVFPYQSPVLERVEVVQAGKVRRAKLYYLRDRVGKKATKIKQRAIESRKKS